LQGRDKKRTRCPEEGGRKAAAGRRKREDLERGLEGTVCEGREGKTLLERLERKGPFGEPLYIAKKRKPLLGL